MLRFLPVFLLSLSLMLYAGCAPDLSANKSIAGTWSGVSWLIDGELTSLNPGEMQFAFNLPDSYTATYGDQTETGVFRLDGDVLYTTAEGRLQIKVRLARPHPDTLIMHMNRSGVEEVLTLARQ